MLPIERCKSMRSLRGLCICGSYFFLSLRRKFEFNQGIWMTLITRNTSPVHVVRLVFVSIVLTDWFLIFYSSSRGGCAGRLSSFRSTVNKIFPSLKCMDLVEKRRGSGRWTLQFRGLLADCLCRHGPTRLFNRLRGWWQIWRSLLSTSRCSYPSYCLVNYLYFQL